MAYLADLEGLGAEDWTLGKWVGRKIEQKRVKVNASCL